MMNLALYSQDFNVKAGWTFTSFGHGISPCDGLGAVVKSATSRYLLKQDPEAAFSSAKEFYQFTLEKTSRMLSPAQPTRLAKPPEFSVDEAEEESTDEETDFTTSRPDRSIEVRWIDEEEEVERTFQTVLKQR